MADNDSNKVETTQLTQKFIKNTNESMADGKSVSHHRNGMFQSVKNTEIFATNEPSNLFCLNLPYKYLGHVSLKGEQRYLIFSGNEIDSEIGIADTLNCKYEKIVNNKCLAFSKYNNPITGFLRINSEGEEEVIIVDGVNNDRLINLSNIPYKYKINETTKCLTKEFTNELDCEQLQLNPKITPPCIEITKTSIGSLPDGVYFVSLAYTINDLKFTDYYGLTLPVQINKKTGKNGLALKISNLDRDFEKYQVLLTGTVNGITTHKIIGLFSTSQNDVVISDWINEEYQDGIPSSELTVSKKVYDKTGILAANSQYLLRADVKHKLKINYQPQAFNIKAFYYVKQVPLEYYKDNGEDIGYFRNENYNFVVRWYWNDTEKTEHFVIANRKALPSDISIVSGDDIFETDKNEKDCKEKEVVLKWEAYNTASPMINVESDFKCEERIIGYGSMGYNESNYNYPENEEIYGENACTPIRNFRMPDEQRVPRYSKINGKIYVNVLGVKFINIEHPKDENGEYIKGITHYEILRSERDEANSTVISRGIVTNIGGFTDETNNNKEVLYSNFPQNSLLPNSFISKKQTWVKKNKERDFEPLDKFYDDKFSYYSPYGNYFGRKQVNGYLEFETEEIGTVTGYFEDTYNHPKHKLLTNFAYWVAITVGYIESILIIVGKGSKTSATKSGELLGSSGGKYSDSTNIEEYKLNSVEDLMSFDIVGYIASLTTASVGITGAIANASKFAKVVKVLKAALTVIASLAIKIPYSILAGAKLAEQIYNDIKNITGYKSYAKQYNSEVLYDNSLPIIVGNKRRTFLRQPFYLDNGIHSIGQFQVNNGGRNSTIFMELKHGVDFPRTDDDSRKTILEAGVDVNKKQRFNSTSSVFYVTHKQNNPNQYGTIEAFKPVKIHSCLFEADITKISEEELNVFNKEIKYETTILFGGDCIIAEQTHLNKFPLFRQVLSNTNYPDGVPFDYRLYNNVGYPRFWYDSTDLDIGNIMNLFAKTKPTLQKMPNQKYNLDGRNTKDDKWVQEDQCIYTSINGVLRYIVETDANIWFRDNKEEGEGTNIYQPHYSSEQNDLSYIFRSDLQVKKENFLLDPSYQYLDQKYLASTHLTKIQKLPIEEKNTVLYSLPSSSTQTFNNWRYFLPLNIFSFDERDYGTLTGIHAIDQDRLMFLFSKASPFLSNGQDALRSANGRNITIGDGGLFTQVPREMNHTDIAYGSNHDRYAFKSTQFGHFYVSELQGKLFNFDGKLNEYSENGWDKWCAEFLPIRLKREFPEYRQVHNYLSGVGYQIAFDNIYKTIYICKKDFSKKSDDITYNKEKNKFYSGSYEIQLGDPLYFDDCSVTLSYCPALDSFQSFHDWKPDGIIQDERHFITIKDNGLWKHNQRIDSFCNFYGKDYPYELGLQVSTGEAVNIIEAIEYFQEAYIYKTSELDRYHVYDQTFDYAMLYTSEHLSGLLHLNDATNERYIDEKYPVFKGTHSIEIPFKKVENKFRFNMFYDYAKNRGRHAELQIQPFITKKNGYQFNINQKFLDFTIERPPRIRHYFHNVWFQRSVSENINFITKFNNTKMLLSQR